MVRRAAVFGLIIAAPLAAAISGCRREAALPDFSALVAAYGSAVVNIAAAQTVRASDPASGRGVIVLAEGSGFIVSPDGVILTSAHLVARADTVVVTLTDRRQFNTRVLGQDKESDVAVMKIDAKDLPTVRLGDSSGVRPGEWVIAIGSPFGFENTVTSGIVSARSRFLPDQPYVAFIQTDVPVNPGNSGGPLFNVNGEVVGINVAMYSASGGFMGLSFAVPIDVAVKVKDRLLRDGRVRRGSLGMATQDLTQRFADSVGLPKRQGALVITVEEDGPAAKAGLKPGDVILSMDGTLINEANELPRWVADVEPGSQTRLHIWRYGQGKDIAAILGELTTYNEKAADALH